MREPDADRFRITDTLKLDRLRRRAHISLAAGCAVLISLLVASYMQTSTGLEVLRQIEVANERSDRLDRLRQRLTDAETSVRGYALTGDAAYLKLYQEALPVIRSTVAAVREDYAGDPGARTAVNKMTGLLLTELNTLNTIVGEVGAGQVVGKGRFEYGKALMDVYRDQHNKMKQALYADNRRSVTKSVGNFENTRVVTVLLSICALVLLILAVSANQEQKTLRDQITRLLKSENERLEFEVRARTAELTELATYLTNVRETEKRHLARELHDELGALLTAAKFDVDWIERNLSADARPRLADRLARIQQNLVGVITLKRRIINDLRPALLDDLGLVEALRAMFGEYAQTGNVEVALDLPDAEPPLSEAAALGAYRIVQEALTNARKYAQARHVRLSLRTAGEAVELEVADDGKGFDPDGQRQARHGLAGIRHRVYTLGGRLEIRSAPGAGTTIAVSLPLAA